MLDDFTFADDWGPEKVVTVTDPKTGMRGALVIDNTARGIGKGGTRMSPTLTITEVARLARVMTWKWAAVDLRFGGAKAGIRFDPASPDKETVLRRFARALCSEVPGEYVFGLDISVFPVEADTVLTAVSKRLRSNTAQVLLASDLDHSTPHQAARRLAQKRVRAAMDARDRSRGL